jgi:hypothetical protein
MGQAKFRIVRHKGGWGIAQEGTVSGDYLTKEAAFEAAVMPASHAIKQGHGVVITVDESHEGEPALGKT